MLLTTKSKQLLIIINRISYCRNNPLKYTDPSGDFITWSINNGGFSIGFNFTPAGIPLGAGINIGWGDGFSLGVYGEVGYRVGGTGMGTGVTLSQSLGYNFSNSSWSTATSYGAYGSFGVFNAGVNFSESYSSATNEWNNSWGVSAGVGIGFKGDAGIGLSGGYGSGGPSYGINGYINPPKVYKSPVSDNLGIIDGSCGVLALEESSSSYGLSKYDRDKWYELNGGSFPNTDELEGLINKSDAFASERIGADIYDITNAMSDDKRILVGFNTKGESHAVMLNKAVVWPSGRYRVWFAETSPVRIAPYTTNDLGHFNGATSGTGYWTFYRK